jgi:branched-chain amino acid transport system ATP-binding protein
MDAILEVSNVTKCFGGLAALENVSFQLQRDEILGLIGPNGAGKTTLVSLINGTLRPTKGELVFNGTALEGMPAYKRARLGIGRTFQITRPFPTLTVLDNVAVGALFGTGGGQRELKAARTEALKWLEFVDLAHRAEQRAEALGGPDRKRLELAKALAMKPTLLLLDEVMAGLNHAEIDEVIAVIKKVRAAGISILVIEHVMKAIHGLSDRVLVLNYGRKIAEGPPDVILNDPQVIEAYLGRRRA